MPQGFYKRSGRWGFFYRDSLRRRRYKTGYSNLDETRKLKDRTVDRERQIRDGILDPTAERIANASKQPLMELVGEWQRYLVSRRNTPQHVTERVQMVSDVIAEVKARRLSDLIPATVQGAIHDLKSKPRGRRARGIDSLNRHVKACRQFGRWLETKAKAVISNPLSGLELYHATDAVEWAALTDDQVVKLIAATEKSHDKTRHCNIRSWDRAMMYRIAFATGFRANELKSLTKESFDLPRSTVSVQANFSKRKRRDVQDLPDMLVGILRGWLITKNPGKQLFRLPADTARMFRRDLKAAGIGPVDEEGRPFVFHSTRETLATQLAEAGVEPNDAKSVMRHSTIALTMDTYAKVRRRRTRDAVNLIGNGALAPALQHGGNSRDELGRNRTFRDHPPQSESDYKTLENKANDGKKPTAPIWARTRNRPLRSLIVQLTQLIDNKVFTTRQIVNAALCAARQKDLRRRMGKKGDRK